MKFQKLNQKIGIKYVRLNLRYLYLYHPIKNINDKFGDVIPVNDISTYNQDVVGHVYLKESPPPQVQKNTTWYKVT